VAYCQLRNVGRRIGFGWLFAVAANDGAWILVFNRTASWKHVPTDAQPERACDRSGECQGLCLRPSQRRRHGTAPMEPGCFKSNTSVGILTGTDWPLFETFNGTTESELAAGMNTAVWDRYHHNKACQMG